MLKNEEIVPRKPTFSAFLNAAFKSKPSKTSSDQNDEGLVQRWESETIAVGARAYAGPPLIHRLLDSSRL